jgi:hypothetical protein
MTTTDTSPTPDLAGAEAYVATGLHARPGETWYITTDGTVHHRRVSGEWNEASILTAADLRGSDTWQRVEA